MTEKEKEETAEQKLRKVVKEELIETLKKWKMELPEHTHASSIQKDEKPAGEPLEEKIEENCPECEKPLKGKPKYCPECGAGELDYES